VKVTTTTPSIRTSATPPASAFSAQIEAIAGVRHAGSVGETLGRLVGDEDVDVLAQRALVAFQRLDVVGLLVGDRLGSVALAAHGIDGDDRPLDRQHGEQLRDSDDFVGFLAHLDLAQDQLLACREGRDPVDRGLAVGFPG
jgi:hypothetical protein